MEQLPPQQGTPHRDAAAGRCLHFRCRAASAGGHQAEVGAGEKLPQHGADRRQREQQPQQRRDISARGPAQQQPAALRQPFPAAPQRRREQGVQQRTALLIAEEIKGKEAQRRRHGEECLMPPGLRHKQSHRPAQQRRQHRRRPGQQQSHRHSAQDAAQRMRREPRISRFGGHPDEEQIEQAHLIQAAQPHRKDHPRRDGQSQQKVVVLGLKKAVIAGKRPGQHADKKGQQFQHEEIEGLPAARQKKLRQRPRQRSKTRHQHQRNGPIQHPEGKLSRLGALLPGAGAPVQKGALLPPLFAQQGGKAAFRLSVHRRRPPTLRRPFPARRRPAPRPWSPPG